jgi:hypothetical protein
MTEISRRSFVSTAMGGLALSAATGVAQTRTARKYPYIDIHTHLGTFYWGKALLADELVKMMDVHGVEKACILPLVSPEAGPFPQTSEQAIQAYEQFPDRLIPFCCIDPRCCTLPPLRPGHVVGKNGIKDMLKKYQDAGCKGVGEHKTGLPFDHPHLMLLYEACDEVGLPILFHLDDIRNPDTPGLPRLENVLKAFPQLPLIGHAAGFWASISGDATIEDFGRYPEVPKKITSGGALDRLMEKYPNLYGDLSEPGGEKALARDREFAREFLIRRADQLLFGTDFLMIGQTAPQFELLDSFELPDDVQRKIFRDNARRLLRI